MSEEPGPINLLPNVHRCAVVLTALYFSSVSLLSGLCMRDPRERIPPQPPLPDRSGQDRSRSPLTRRFETVRQALEQNSREQRGGKQARRRTRAIHTRLLEILVERIDRLEQTAGYLEESISARRQTALNLIDCYRNQNQFPADKRVALPRTATVLSADQDYESVSEAETLLVDRAIEVPDASSESDTDLLLVEEEEEVEIVAESYRPNLLLSLDYHQVCDTIRFSNKHVIRANNYRVLPQLREALQELKALYPEIKVVITSYTRSEYYKRGVENFAWEGWPEIDHCIITRDRCGFHGKLETLLRYQAELVEKENRFFHILHADDSAEILQEFLNHRLQQELTHGRRILERGIWTPPKPTSLHPVEGVVYSKNVLETISGLSRILHHFLESEEAASASASPLIERPASSVVVAQAKPRSSSSASRYQ